METSFLDIFMKFFVSEFMDFGQIFEHLYKFLILLGVSSNFLHITDKNMYMYQEI